MTWIDEARKRKAEAERIRNAQEAEEAKKVAQVEACQAKESNKFAREVKRLLPRGVELAAVFAERDGPVARVRLSNGVQFDLRPSSTSGGYDSRGNVSSFHYRHWGASGYSIAHWGDSGTNLPGKRSSIEAYTATGDYSITYYLASTSTRDEWMWKPRFSKRQMEDLLFNALEKHNSKRKTR
jgi:hypothetical protein